LTHVAAGENDKEHIAMCDLCHCFELARRVRNACCVAYDAPVFGSLYLAGGPVMAQTGCEGSRKLRVVGKSVDDKNDSTFTQ